LFFCSFLFVSDFHGVYCLEQQLLCCNWELFNLSVVEVTDDIDTESAYKSFVMELMNAQASRASLLSVCARASEGFKELLDWLNKTATLAAIV
jgi:hypothetical protein